jgi:hypothetical protein
MRRRNFLHGVALLAAGPDLRGREAPKMSVLSPALIASGAAAFTAVHTMVDTPQWSSGNGRDWDPRRYVDLCRQAHVEIIELKTKNAMGDAMFPFKNRPCPKDWTTETRRVAKNAGIRFIAYYNVGLDNWMARKRPEWACIDPGGKKKLFASAFNWMCIRSPWRDVVLDELRQVQAAIEPDGIWFDLLGAPNGYGIGSFEPADACFCGYCRAAYREMHGGELPTHSEDPEIRLRVNRFGHAARVAMLRDACNLARSLNPAVWLGYNHSGPDDDLAATPREVQDLITFHSTEAKQHRLISFSAKGMWPLGKPYQVHSYGGFIQMLPGDARGTWSAWNLIPPSYMKVSAALANAHSGRISVGVNPLPSGDVYASELRNLAATFDEVAKRQSWLAGLSSVPNIAIAYDWPSDLAFLALPGNKGRPVQQECAGLHDALIDAAVHFDVVNSDRLESSEYRTILIGDALCASASLERRLRAFVEAGGLLIVTHETSLGNNKAQRLDKFAWGDLLGVRFTGVSPFEEANFGMLGSELRGDSPGYPVLFRTRVLEIACTSARPLAELVYPAAHRTRDVFTDGETPYTNFGNQSTGKPLITLNRVGKGAVIYIAAPIGREIASREDPWLKRIVVECVRKFSPPLAIQVDAPPGIQVVFGRRSAQMHVVSLVNHYSGLDTAAGTNPVPWVGPARARVPLETLGRRPSAVYAIGVSGLKWAWAREVLEIEMASVGHHGVLVIQ